MNNDDLKEGIQQMKAIMEPFVKMGMNTEQVTEMLQAAAELVRKEQQAKEAQMQEEDVSKATAQKKQQEYTPQYIDTKREENINQEQGRNIDILVRNMTDEKVQEEDIDFSEEDMDIDIEEEDIPDMDGLSEEDKAAGIGLEEEAERSENTAKTPISEIEKRAQDKAELKEAKREWKDAKKDLNQLHKEYLKEKTIAEMNVAGSPEHKKSLENIDRMEDKIYRKTQEVQDLKAYYKDKKPSIMQLTNSLGKVASERAQRALIKMDILKDRQIANGKQAIRNIKNLVKDANKRFQVKGLTAYNGLEEKVAQNYRGYLGRQYKYEKMEQKVTRGLRKTLEKTFDLKNDLANRVQNVGRALTGKQFKERETELAMEGKDRFRIQYKRTDAQHKLIGAFKRRENELDKSMADLATKYQVSRMDSLEKMQNLQKERQGLGLRENKSLSERIQNAIKASDISKSSSKTKNYEKASRTRDER